MEIFALAATICALNSVDTEIVGWDEVACGLSGRGGTESTANSDVISSIHARSEFHEYDTDGLVATVAKLVIL